MSVLSECPRVSLVFYFSFRTFEASQSGDSQRLTKEEVWQIVS